MIVYDAGALVAADRSERSVWADHRARLELGIVPSTTAPVVSQVSRTPQQAQLRRFLRGCEIVPFAAADAHDVGAVAGRSGINDVVDVHVAVVAGRSQSAVITSDDRDLRRVIDALPVAVPIIRI